MFAGVPTVVKTNILIRSMGPVSELDMVIRTCIPELFYFKIFYIFSTLINQKHIIEVFMIRCKQR